MAAWHELDDLTCEIAFGETPQATSPTYTDVTTWWSREDTTIFRGRTSEYADIAPGTARIVLRNEDRRFDPDYTSSPYNGDLVPMVRVRIKATLGATTVVLFVGYILGWQQEWQHTTGTVTVTAVDATRILENLPLPPSQIYPLTERFSATDPFHVFPFENDTVLDDGRVVAIANDSGSHLSLNLAESATPAQYGTIEYPIGHPRCIQATPGDLPGGYSAFPGIGARSVQFWASIPADTVAATDAASTYVQVFSSNLIGGKDEILSVTASLESTEVLYSNTIDVDRSLDVSFLPVPWKQIPGGGPTRPVHVVVTADATNISMYVDGQLYDQATLDTSATTNGVEETVGLIAVAPASTTEGPKLGYTSFHYDPLTAADVTALYEAGRYASGHPLTETAGERIDRALDDAGWSSSLRNIDTGGTPQASYLPARRSALDYIREVAESEQGLFFVDVDGQARFVDRQTLWTAAPVATFTDDGNAGDLEYVSLQPAGNSVDALRNTVTVPHREGESIESDSTSVDNYSAVSETLSTSTILNGELGSNLANYIIRQAKDPRTYVSRLVAVMRIDGGDNEFEKLAAIELGDLVTVEHTPVALGSQIVRTLLVQGIEHRINADQWTVTLYLSPAPTNAETAPYLTLGDLDDGKIGVTDGNLIPA